MSDPQTRAAYAREAERYRARFADKGADDDLQAFLDALPEAADVLDLGCGPGRAASLMKAAGHRVIAYDATPEFVAQAQALGVDARLARFEDLTDVEAFDGIWANFSLLHAPRSEMPLQDCFLLFGGIVVILGFLARSIRFSEEDEALAREEWEQATAQAAAEAPPLAAK